MIMYYGKVVNKLTGKPIPDIIVSDGRNSTLTDKNGNYVLDGWEKSNTVSVGVLTKDHSDWFKYTDNKPGQYDFEITPWKVQKGFGFLHTSDTEIHERENVAWVSFAKECVLKYNPAFFIHTGDICRKPGLEKHYKVTNVDNVGCPVRFVIGNHDFCDGDYGEQLFEKLYGPVWYSFDCADYHFIVLSIGKGEKPSGYTLEQQWIWLKNDLEKNVGNKPVIVFSHDSCDDEYDYIIKSDNFSIDLKKYNIKAWIFGHIHTNYHHIRGNTANICTTCPDCGGVDSSAAGLRFVSTDKETISSHMIYDGLIVNRADKAIWQTKLDGNIQFADIKHYCGDIFAATMRDGYPQKCGIYRLDGKTGEIKWFFETVGGIRNSFSLDEEKLYAQDSAGDFYCLNIEDGSLVFRKKLVFHKIDYSILSTIVVKDKVFTGRNKEIYAFDKITGEQIWKLNLVKGSNSASKLVYDYQSDHLIVGNQWRNLNCVDAATGEIIWQSTDTLVWHRNSTPLLENGVIYTCGAFEIGKIDVKTGEILLKTDIDTELNTVGAPVIYKGDIYFPSSGKGVVVYDKDTLEFKKAYPCSHSHLFTVPYIYNENEIQMVECSPVVKDNALTFGASDGKVYFYDIESGNLKKTITVEGPVLTKPIITEENIFIADFLGNVYKYNL